MGNKKKIIMLLTPMELPIPAVGGGAIETLITNILEVNEKEKRARIVVISKSDEKAQKVKYKQSGVYYFDDNTIIEGVGIFKVLWKMYILWRKIFQNRIIKKIIRKEYDEMDFFVFQCYRIAKHEGVSCVINEGRHDERRWGAFNVLIGKDNFYNHIHYNRNADINAQKVIHNSLSISGYVREHWIDNSSPIGKNFVLYNGIDINRFEISMSVQKRQAERQILGFSSEDTVVVFCGRLIEEKGIIELLDAFDILSKEPIKLLLIGSSSFSKGNQTKFSEDVVKRASLMPNVNYLGYVRNEDLPMYYALSDIMVIPSVCQEGAGLVAIEGMAAGLPLIITKSGGMIEYVDRKNSIQISIDENLSTNLALEIEKLSKDEKRRELMSMEGKKRAQLFTKEKYYENLINMV